MMVQVAVKFAQAHVSCIFRVAGTRNPAVKIQKTWASKRLAKRLSVCVAFLLPCADSFQAENPTNREAQVP